MTNVVVINPRSLHFAERRATSIDLCVRDLVRFSRFSATTTVIGDAVEGPFSDVAFRVRPTVRFDHFLTRTRALRTTVDELAPDIVSVQEHLRTAVYLAGHLKVPVLLQQHNPVRPPKGALDKFLRTRSYNRLAGIILVSEALSVDFGKQWPGLTVPRYVVPNGLDMSAWKPNVERDKTILVVGRAIPAKGITEAAEALASVLPKYPAWQAVFILNEVQAQPDYFENVVSVLNGVGSQVMMLTQRPGAEVKSKMESAAIAIVPSKWIEPFGRTALEAHAGGAAVISSGTGGLREVSGDTAIFLPAVTSKSISEAVATLIEDQELRSKLASSGRERVKSLFDSRAIAARCDDVYLATLSRKSAKTL